MFSFSRFILEFLVDKVNKFFGRQLIPLVFLLLLLPGRL